VSNFIAMATKVGSGRICVTIFASLTTKTPGICKNLRDISYIKGVITDFHLKFHCHGNRGHPGVNLNDAVKLADP